MSPLARLLPTGSTMAAHTDLTTLSGVSPSPSRFSSPSLFLESLQDYPSRLDGCFPTTDKMKLLSFWHLFRVNLLTMLMSSSRPVLFLIPSRWLAVSVNQLLSRFSSLVARPNTSAVCFSEPDRSSCNNCLVATPLSTTSPFYSATPSVPPRTCRCCSVVSTWLSTPFLPPPPGSSLSALDVASSSSTVLSASACPWFSSSPV